MPTHLIRKDSREDIEIAAKQAELSALEARFAEQELAFVTAEADVRKFERRYVAKLGALFARLDGIEAEIAEIDANRHPQDSEKGRHANYAKARAWPAS